MDDSLTRAVQRRFALEPYGATPIEEGDEALVWRAETDQAPIIVHVGPAWRSDAELA